MKDALTNLAEDFYAGLETQMTDIADLGSGTNVSFGNIISKAVSTNAFGNMAAIGASLLICMFLIHLGESALKDKNDPDGLFKEFALLGLYSIITANLRGILTSLTAIASDISSKVSGAFYTHSGSFSVEAEQLHDHFISMFLDVAVFIVFGNIAIMIVKIVAYIAIYTAKIELFIRTVFFPLAVGFIAEDGWRGPGGRYVKRWVACCMQLAIITVTLKSYVAVMFSTVGSGQGTPMVAVLAGGFAAAGICMKSSQLSNEIMGT